ncbi:MAG: 4-hydroxy-tetrahydrodipicolinate reductase [Caldimonas sp.]
MRRERRKGRPVSARRRVAIAGSSGRMGRTLIEAVEASTDFALGAAFDLGDDIRAALAASDVLIDFTRPDGSLAHLALCRELGVAAVIGTTGFDTAQKAQIAAHAEHVAVVMAPNMSVGVNVMLKLLEVAAATLGDGFDVEIVETHHRHKVDAPSGTALQMGEVVARAQASALDDRAAFDRNGLRRPGAIGFASLRGGDIVGDHTVLFAGAGERIEITHRSTSRATYAEGSLRAARFLAGKTHGLFGMEHVLGLAGPAEGPSR